MLVKKQQLKKRLRHRLYFYRTPPVAASALITINTITKIIMFCSISLETNEATPGRYR